MTSPYILFSEPGAKWSLGISNPMDLGQQNTRKKMICEVNVMVPNVVAFPI